MVFRCVSSSLLDDAEFVMWISLHIDNIALCRFHEQVCYSANTTSIRQIYHVLLIEIWVSGFCASPNDGTFRFLQIRRLLWGRSADLTQSVRSISQSSSRIS